MIEVVGKSFEEVALKAEVQLKDVLDYRDIDSFELFLSAFNKDKIQNLNNIPLCEVNTSFREKCDFLRDKIFKEALRPDTAKYKNLTDWLKEAGTVWAAVNDYDDILVV